MLTMFVSRLWILSRSTSNPASSFAACLFNLAFCHCAKILKDHFVTYRVDFGTDFSNSAFSSSAVFNSLNFLFGGILAHPRCKNLSPSPVTNKEIKTIERTNIIVTKQRKTSQDFTPVFLTNLLRPSTTNNKD